jgi:hypothetical protein
VTSPLGPPGPPLPPFGTPPQHPPHPPHPPHPQGYYPAPAPAPKKDRTADLVISWLLFVAQLLGAATMAVISIFAVFIDAYCSDGSGSCYEDRSGTAMVGYWIALGVLLVATLIGMIVASSTRRAVWPWAVGGSGLSVVATIVFFAVLAS